jgi:hypothetical protein
MKNGPSSVKKRLPLLRSVRSKGKTLIHQLEIDLAPKRVDAGDSDSNGVAEAELAAEAAAFDEVLLLVIMIGVVRERRKLD